ncbi:MAG: site-2 protease family protein [Candidatus Micrarchaeota archaeon]|nr:site-2 protease family protein [Candidatus Micrarchaeota archaeon]
MDLSAHIEKDELSRGTNISTISLDEAKHIIISVLAISIAFSIAYLNTENQNGISVFLKYPASFLLFCFFSLVGVGSGFILHELGHKIVAIHYGAYAKFNMWTKGLIFMFITSIFGMLFAAPGAVYIYSSTITKKQNGIISAVGPIINLVIALVFVFLMRVKPLYIPFPFEIPVLVSTNNMLDVWLLGAQMNVVLSLFNMIPAFPLDGSKVFMWNKFAWVGIVLVCMIIAVKIFSSIDIVITWLVLMAIALVFSKLVFRS